MKELPAFLRGKQTILRPIHEETDAEPMFQWVNDPGVIHFTMGYLPQTLRQEKEWMEKIGKDDKNIHLAVEAVESGGKRILIGAMGIHRINWVDRNAYTGAMIGNKDYWGKGYGTDAKMSLIEYAFNTLNLHRLCSRVFDFNARSLKYLLKCGYKEEGRRRQHAFVNGVYRDVIELGLLREDWLPVMEKYRKSDDDLSE